MAKCRWASLVVYVVRALVKAAAESGKNREGYPTPPSLYIPRTRRRPDRDRGMCYLSFAVRKPWIEDAEARMASETRLSLLFFTLRERFARVQGGYPRLFSYGSVNEDERSVGEDNRMLICRGGDGGGNQGSAESGQSDGM